MLSIAEIYEAIENNPITGIIVKSTNKKYMRGENPYYDMEINNYWVWEKEGRPDDYYGFDGNIYEPVYD